MSWYPKRPRKRHVTTIRLDDAEYAAVEALARDLGVPKAELWRRLLVTVKVLYDKDLRLRDAIMETEELAQVRGVLKGSNVPLCRALKSIPKLIEILSAADQKTLGAQELRRASPRTTPWPTAR